MNPEKPSNSEADALKRMGHDAVMQDLQRKYGVKSEAQSTGAAPSIMPEKTWRVLVESRNAFLKSLEGLPVESHVKLPDEVVNLLKVNRILDAFLDDHEKSGKFSDKEGLRRLIEVLDRVTIWKYKYATECSGGAGGDVPMQDYDPEMDSLYYSTSSGATLRLKTAKLHDGFNLRAVVQSITEKVTFLTVDGELSELPEIGSSVREYSSPAFDVAIRNRDVNQYKSGLRIYRRGNMVAAVSHSTDPETGQEDFAADHDGDRVNKIFPIN